MPHLISIENRILSKVSYVDNCWIWNGATSNKNSFPQIRIDKRNCRVRELILNLFDGIDIPSNMDIRHSCSNSLCINPDHLYLEFRSGRPNFKNRQERKKRDFAIRFWEKVDRKSDSECWEWMASVDGKGYGQINIKRKMHRAHRIAYLLTFGEFSNALEVCHHCDNPLCCNPNHLFLGTQDDNMKDMAEKGRASKTNKPYGEQHGNAKFSNSDIIKFRSFYASGNHNIKEIAKVFNVNYMTMYEIIRRKTWRHI